MVDSHKFLIVNIACDKTTWKKVNELHLLNCICLLENTVLSNYPFLTLYNPGLEELLAVFKMKLQ